MRRVVLTLLFCAGALCAPVHADPESGVTTSPPIAVSSAAPDRAALVVATGTATPARADALRYRDLLRRLGFRVMVVEADTRPELKSAFGAFAAQIKTGGDVAVFVLGALLPKGEDLYLFGSEAETPLEQYETEGLRLAEALRPVAQAGAHDTVVFVDTCHEARGQACRVGPATFPDNVSAITGERLKPDGSGAPVAGLASLAPELLPLMQRKDLSDLALFGALKERLAGTNMTVAASPSLSRTFAFLPAGFLAGLPSLCNRVDPAADAESLKTAAPIGLLVPACAQAADTWSFSPWFKDRLAAAREQASFQTALKSCAQQPGRAYLDAYPDGRYAAAARAFVDQCEAERRRAEAPPPPAPAAELEPISPRPTPKEAPSTCTVGGLDPAGNNWLALRDTPSYQSHWSTTRMGPGTVVSLYGREGDWAHVRLASGESGWANGKFLFCSAAAPSPESEEESPAKGACFVTGLDPNGDNWLALRDRPSGKGPWSQTHMGPGTPLFVFGRSGPWLHVRLASGETGWASGNYVRCSR